MSTYSAHGDGLDPSVETGPLPTDPMPEQDLQVNAVFTPGLEDHADLEEGRVTVKFNRSLSYWERRQVGLQGFQLEGEDAFSTPHLDIGQSDVAGQLRAIARSIENNAQAERNQLAQQAQSMRLDAEKLNIFLARLRANGS